MSLAPTSPAQQSRRYDEYEDVHHTDEGIEYTKDGQRYLLTEVHGTLVEVPLSPAESSLAIELKPLQQMIDVIRLVDREITEAQQRDRFDTHRQIETDYAGAWFGPIRAARDKAVYDREVYRPNQRAASEETLEALSDLRSDLIGQVKDFSAQRRRAVGRNFERAEELAEAQHDEQVIDVSFTGQFARGERQATANVKRQLRLAGASWEQEAAMASKTTDHDVKVIESQGKVDRDIKKLEVDLARAQADLEAREAEHQRDHELVKKTMDLGKLIPQWQRQIELLQATTPTEMAEAAARDD